MLEGKTAPSVLSLELKPIVTVAVGSDLRTIVNVSFPPSSVVSSPDVGLTIIPALSLSEFNISTLSTGSPSKLGSPILNVKDVFI